jgi:pimeloyl-ACP methyl ester carboxylesterase
MDERFERRQTCLRRVLLSLLVLPVVLLAEGGAAVLAPSPATAQSASSVSGSASLVALKRPTAAPVTRLPARDWRLAGRAATQTTARQSLTTRVVRLAATPCGQTPGLLCSDVVVPLDRSGKTPGTIALKVHVLPAFGQERGVMFLVAGGPGQGSATVFGLGNQRTAEYYRFLFPGYTLVAFDDRGTGQSGLLQCRALQGYYPIEQEEARVAACAASIGPQRLFYSTREHAEDIDAVRQALAAERIGVWGTSYGTKLALAYALAHPTRVERLLLDSVVPTDLDDPYRSTSLREMSKALANLCNGGACRAATPDLAGDVVLVANRLAAKPVQGNVLQPNGKRRSVRITGVDLLNVVIDADLNPGLAAELPAVIRAARLRDMQPLLRMFALDASMLETTPEQLSAGLFAATVCNDGPLPWPADTPVEAHWSLFNAAVDALPTGTLGPFGKWAAQIGNGHFCLGWPPPTGSIPLGPGPLPNVPVLAVSGGIDMRTPAASAQAVISKFPHGRLLVVDGVGHSVIGADPSFCAERAVRSWILDETFADCARPKPYVAFVPAYPAAKRTRVATPRQTFTSASSTVREAEALWLMAVGPGKQVAGLYGGKIVGTGEREFTLVRYSITPGIELSGKIRFTDFGPPLEFDGVVKVGGKLAAAGLLGLSKGSLAGTLGGELVRR